MPSRDLDAPGFKPMNREAVAASDRHFADQYIDAGGALPISRTLAKIIRYKPRQKPPTKPDDEGDDIG